MCSPQEDLNCASTEKAGDPLGTWSEIGNQLLPLNCSRCASFSQPSDSLQPRELTVCLIYTRYRLGSRGHAQGRLRLFVTSASPRLCVAELGRADLSPRASRRTWLLAQVHASQTSRRVLQRVPRCRDAAHMRPGLRRPTKKRPCGVGPRKHGRGRAWTDQLSC